MDRKDLAHHWAEFIRRYMWAWWVTLTFRYPVHPERASKAFNKFIYLLNQNIYGKYYQKRPQDGIAWVRCIEYQKRSVIHYHCLFSRIPGDIIRKVWKDKWNEMEGFANIKIYNILKNCEDYISKNSYMFKDGQIDIGGVIKPKLARIVL